MRVLSMVLLAIPLSAADSAQIVAVTGGQIQGTLLQQGGASGANFDGESLARHGVVLISRRSDFALRNGTDLKEALP